MLIVHRGHKVQFCSNLYLLYIIISVGGIFHIGSKNKIHSKGEEPDYNNLVPSSETEEIETMRYINW